MKTLMTGALVGIFAIAAYAADVTGKWTAEVPGRGGNMQTNTFVLKQDGAKLTGTVDGGRGGAAEISDGKVDGHNVSFARTVSFGYNTFKLVFKGSVNSAGTEIKFTRTIEGGPGDTPPTEFTAKKAN